MPASLTGMEISYAQCLNPLRLEGTHLNSNKYTWETVLQLREEDCRSENCEYHRKTTLPNKKRPLFEGKQGGTRKCRGNKEEGGLENKEGTEARRKREKGVNERKEGIERKEKIGSKEG